MKIKTRIMLALAIVNGLSLLAIVGLASHYLYTTNHLQFHERMEATVSLTAATLADAVTAKTWPALMRSFLASLTTMAGRCAFACLISRVSAFRPVVAKP